MISDSFGIQLFKGSFNMVKLRIAKISSSNQKATEPLNVFFIKLQMLITDLVLESSTDRDNLIHINLSLVFQPCRSNVLA